MTNTEAAYAQVYGSIATRSGIELALLMIDPNLGSGTPVRSGECVSNSLSASNYCVIQILDF